MIPDAYERLAAALDGLANGFPRTESNVELRILRHVFTPDEAEVAAALDRAARRGRRGRPAGRSGACPRRGDARESRGARRDLDGLESRMVRATAWRRSSSASTRPTCSRRATRSSRASSRSTSAAAGAVGIMSAQPAIHRVLPARGATETEWVLPYDDVRAILGKATSFRVEDCVCRLQQDELGTRRCDFPLEACLWFSYAESGDEEGAISRERGPRGARRGGAHRPRAHGEQRGLGHRLRLQLLRLLLRPAARHQRVGHRALGGAGQLLRRDRPRDVHGLRRLRGALPGRRHRRAGRRRTRRATGSAASAAASA